jgi:hypothetical protein
VNGTCFEECPQDTLTDQTDSRFCIFPCYQRTPLDESCFLWGDSSNCYVYNSDCYSTCPYNTRENIKTKECDIVQCDNREFVLETLCTLPTDDTSSSYCYSYNNKCYSTCPPNTRENIKTKECDIVQCNCRIMDVNLYASNR